MHTRRLVVSFASFAVFTVGCGSGDSGGGVDAGSDPDAAIGCPVDDLLCLQQPARGFQIRSMGATIAPGQDVEYCEVVQLPGTPADTYYVKQFETQMTLYSHHLIVVAIEVGSGTDANTTVGQRVPCTGATSLGEDVLPVTGSQHPYHQETFPDQVGRVFTGGQKVIFNYHYLNASDIEVEAQAAVNFHTVDASEVTFMAKSFGFYNLGINTPPGEERGFIAECTFSDDVIVHKLSRHTHQWGTDFSVWFTGGVQDGEYIFTSPNYEDTEHIFAEPILMRAGEGFRFECNYSNTETYPLTFGLKATDEMCILFGTWWEANLGDDVPSQSCFRF